MIIYKLSIDCKSFLESKTYIQLTSLKATAPFLSPLV